MIQAERIGRFEVQERLRANAFAIVYGGRDPFDGRRVQIKFCVATDETIRQRFLKAAERAATLRHPNIATVFEYGSGDSKPYLVQEAFSEESLSNLLGRGEPVDDVFKLYYLIQVARGLQYAHKKEVLHRELRPASVLIERGGEAKIADFGTARLASAFVQLGNGAHRWPAVGWLLPELLLGLELDARSDIYGFGALAFELLTGQAPFVAESLAALVPQILESAPRPLGVHWAECPPELDRLVLRCLARDPGQRFGSMDEVVKALDQVVPVSEPVDVFEEQKTVVIEDIQAIYVSGLTQREESEPGPADHEEPVTVEQPAIVDQEPAIDWAVVVGRVEGLGRRGGEALRAGGRGLLAMTRRVRPRPGWRPKLRVKPVRMRVAGMAIGALLLFGVVGWGVVRMPDQSLPSIPTVAPELPVDQALIENGFLMVQSQPWGEVVRLATRDGDELDLPENPFTPLLLEVAPGLYRVEISRPNLERVEICDVMIEPQGRVTCEFRLATVETSDLFKQTGWWQ